MQERQDKCPESLQKRGAGMSFAEKWDAQKGKAGGHLTLGNTKAEKMK